MYGLDDSALYGILPGTTREVDPSSASNHAGETGHALGLGTGQYGYTPILNGGTPMGSAISDVWDWLNEPFSTPMSPVGIALIVGSVLIAVILWNMILYHIRIAAEAI